MKRRELITLLAAALALSVTPALSWYQGALKHRDYMVDAALVFTYYEKCDAGPIPSDLKARAEEKLNMAGPSAARGARGDVAALVKKLGVKQFCEEYRRELTTGENIVVTGGERPSTVNPASTQPGLSQSKRVGDWTLSLDYVEGADQVKGRIAGTDELSKRGQPLMLLGCSEGRLNTSETRSSLKMLYFVDGPEDGFWQGEPLTRGGTRLGWIRFKSAEDDEYPRLFDTGIYGYYFELDVRLGGDLLIRENSFAICPMKNAAAQQCPPFQPDERPHRSGQVRLQPKDQLGV